MERNIPAFEPPDSAKFFHASNIVQVSLAGVVVSVAVGYAPNSIETLARTMFLSVLVYVLVELYVERRVATAVYQYAMKQKSIAEAGSCSRPTKDGSETALQSPDKALSSSPLTHPEVKTTADVDAAESTATSKIVASTKDEEECHVEESDKEVIADAKAVLTLDEAEVVDTDEKVEEEVEKVKEDPEELLCPILQCLMTDPVITEDGFTYERSAIEHWLKDHDTSPKTGKKLRNKKTIPNHIVRAQLQTYREKAGLPPAKPWQPPEQPENSNDAPSNNRPNGNRVTIQVSNGARRVVLNRNGNGGNSRQLAPQSQRTQSISDMLSEPQLQILYATVSNILDQNPFLIQDLRLVQHNGSPLAINIAAQAVVNNPNLWNEVLPYILDNDEAKAIVEPILDVMQQAQQDHEAQNHANGNSVGGNQQQCSGRSNYANIHPIFEAVAKDDVRAMQRMLPSSTTGHNPWPGIEPWPLHGKTPDGNGLLHFACREEKIQCIKYLLTLDIDINATDRIRSTPLHLASFFGREDAVRLLLEYNKEGNDRCDTNKHMMNGDTPLHQAAWNGHIGVMKLLLQHEAKPNAMKEDGSTPLQLAALRSQCKSVRFLLEHGASATAGDVNGNLPIHASSGKGCEHAINYLSASSPETINCQNNAGEAPIHIATWFGKYHNVAAIVSCFTHYILQRQNDEETSDVKLESMKDLIEVKRKADGGTPLCLAIIRGHAHLVKIFLEKFRANPNAKLDHNNETPLHLAASQNSGAHLQIMKLLLQNIGDRKGAKIDVNAKMKNGFTPLLVAVANNCLNAVEVLLSHGALIGSQSSNGTTALMIASESGNIDCLRVLLNFFDSQHEGAQHGTMDGTEEHKLHLKRVIDKQRVDGKSALHLGTISGVVEIVEELLKHNADPFLKNVGGILPIEIAQQMNHNVIAGILKRHMDERT